LGNGGKAIAATAALGVFVACPCTATTAIATSNAETVRPKSALKVMQLLYSNRFVR
jgi:hypothetical protein